MKPNSLLLAASVTLLFLGTPLIAEEPTEILGGILPAELHDASGKPVDASTLKGKTVALYFSAHWCPPCRAFTPSLVKFRDANADKDFEIVFVSLDNSAGEKKTYIKEMEMKWLTVPGAQSKEARELAERFEIRGIPSLIVLAPDGTVVTTNGREDVMISPDTALEKWKAKDRS
ncbi:MAG: redoxin family protein [Verrucomicrobiae bacterium]|nr:redoxin family protein [Verrucomicrobiae bacterium]